MVYNLDVYIHYQMPELPSTDLLWLLFRAVAKKGSAYATQHDLEVFYLYMQ